MTHLLFLVLAAGAAPAPQPAPAEAADPAVFQRALDRLGAGALDEAAGLFFQYASTAPAADERYGSAQLQLGNALARLGLRHAAATVLARIALDRTDPQLVPEAVEQLLGLTQAPHDEELAQDVFATLDVWFLPQASSASVHHVQGLRSLRLAQARWSQFHFSQIPAGTPEAVKAKLARAVSEIERAGKIKPRVLQDLASLSQEPGLSAPLRNEVLLALARLRYEVRDYQGALDAYQGIQLAPLDPGHASLYFEEAWTRYRLGQHSAAMGMLVALEAPSFRDEFLPEKYLLRALVYRDLCHYLPAKRAAEALGRQYASALKRIEERGELTEDEQLLRAATSDGATGRSRRFLQALEEEGRRVTQLGARLGAPLERHLTDLYRAAGAEARRRYELHLAKAVRAKADKLLAAAEQARLLEYEIGLRLDPRAGGDEAGSTVDETASSFPRKAVFRFRGEYWNDELRKLRLLIRDRCEEVAAR